MRCSQWLNDFPKILFLCLEKSNKFTVYDFISLPFPEISCSSSLPDFREKQLCYLLTHSRSSGVICILSLSLERQLVLPLWYLCSLLPSHCLCQSLGSMVLAWDYFHHLLANISACNFSHSSLSPTGVFCRCDISEWQIRHHPLSKCIVLPSSPSPLPAMSGFLGSVPCLPCK